MDTNILISGLLFKKGPPSEIVHMAAQRQFQLVTSGQLLDELEGVLRTRFDFNEEEASCTSGFLKGISIVTEPEEVPKVVLADPDDDKLFAAAICGNAKIIVSGDGHVKAIKRFCGIDVYGPREFLDFMKGK